MSSKQSSSLNSTRILDNIPRAHARADAQIMLNWLRSGVSRRRLRRPSEFTEYGATVARFDFDDEDEIGGKAEPEDDARSSTATHSLSSWSGDLSDAENFTSSLAAVLECSDEKHRRHRSLSRRKQSVNHDKFSERRLNKQNKLVHLNISTIPDPLPALQRRGHSYSYSRKPISWSGLDEGGDGDTGRDRRLRGRLSSPYLGMHSMQRRLTHCQSNPQVCSSSSTQIRTPRMTTGPLWDCDTEVLRFPHSPLFVSHRARQASARNASRSTASDRNFQRFEDQEQACRKMIMLSGLNHHKSFLDMDLADLDLLD